MKALLAEWRQVAHLVHGLPAIRRNAIARGDRSIRVRNVWPVVLVDIAGLIWWRGLYQPVVDRLPSTKRAQAAARADAVAGCSCCAARWKG